MNTAVKINQRYTIIKKLGGGFSGDVLLVEDPDGNQMALKFLKMVQLNVSREDALLNFKNEFTILKELNHPNISRILDFGYDPEIRKYYYTSEFIDGKELHEACENQPIEVKEKLIVQILRALNYLHSKGIFHFDIKPQNILVQMDGDKAIKAKIIDFGLAGFTSPGKKVGTPSYMAPEVIQGGILDGRTDLYSAGVVFYKILTTENPFAAKKLKETLDNQLQLIPKKASDISPDLPKYWDHILEALLQKKPSDRYNQASMAIRDLNLLSNKNFDVETKDTKLSYLPERGALIGRDQEWKIFTDLFDSFFVSKQEDNDTRILIIQGQKGTGKTRLLSEIKHYAQLKNIPVKSLKQFENENASEELILLVDEAQITHDDINSLLQKTFTINCLIVWATEDNAKPISNAKSIHLQNYTKQQLKEYIENVTGLSDAPQKLIEQLHNHTGGNPLFVTEFVKSLLESDLLYDSSGKWDAKTFDDIEIDFEKIHVPHSVDEYYKFIYESLSVTEREIVSWISIYQQPLPKSALNEFIKKLDDENCFKSISSLIEQNILSINIDDQEDSLIIKSELLAQTIYDNIPTTEKQDKHDSIANYLKSINANRKIILHHMSRGSLDFEALTSLYELGRIFYLENLYHKASECFQMAKLRLEKINDEEIHKRWFFKIELENASSHIKMNQFKDAIDILNRLRTHDSIEQKQLLNVLDKLVFSYLSIDEMDKANKEISFAESLLGKNTEDKTNPLIFSNHKSLALLKEGKIEEATTLSLDSFNTWQHQLSEKEQLLVTNNHLIEAYLLKQDYKQAIDVCKIFETTLLKIGDKQQLAFNHYASGDVYYRYYITQNHKNPYKIINQSILYFNQCEKLAREINNYRLMLRAFNGLGNIYNDQKNYKKSLEYYNRALTVSKKIKESLTSALISYNIGTIYLRLEKFKKSYTYFIYAINNLENLKRINSPHVILNLFLCYLSLSENLIHLDQLDKAHTNLDKAEDLFKSNAILKGFEYWKESRRALIYIREDNFEKGKQHAQKARLLAKSTEEKLDFHKTLHSFDIQEQQKEKTKLGVHIMEENKNPSNNDENLKKIIEINQFINSEYDINQLLKVVLNYAIQLSHAESGFVILLDEEQSFEIKSAMNTSQNDEDQISFSIAKMAIEKGEIICSSDAVSDDRFDSSESIVLNELKSVICLPIKSKNKSIGVFYLDNKHRLNAFDECNTSLLNAFCDQVGIAFTNASLIHDLMEARKKLEEQLHKTSEELDVVKKILKEESDKYKTKYAYKNIISRSQSMQMVFKLLDKITETNLSTYIHGESGTGKELIAKSIHYNNPQRKDARFVAINCGAIPAHLMESELFGHKAGSFTGATKDKKGLFEEANGGTIFLDEIAELDMQLQVKLLRVLQENEIQRVGDTKITKIDVRIVCASHQNLEDLIQKSKFREDLYYRLCQMKIDLPPLRNRIEDIPLLAEHFVKQFQTENKIQDSIQIPPRFMKALMEYNWLGNIRELENLIAVACALRDDDQLNLDNLPPNYKLSTQVISQNSASLQTNSSETSQKQTRDVFIDKFNSYDPSLTWYDYEKIILAKCFLKNECKKVATSDELGMSHSTIYKKVQELNLDDSNNPLFSHAFEYQSGTTMKEYVTFIFQAALVFHDNHPYAAIKQLGISQGYFYKIMKKMKKEIEEDSLHQS